MWFRKKKDKAKAKGKGAGADSAEHKAYNDVLSDRLSAIGNHTHDYDESERDEVEARIRRMFYGAKVEGSLAERANEARGEDEAEPKKDAFGVIDSFGSSSG